MMPVYSQCCLTVIETRESFSVYPILMSETAESHTHLFSLLDAHHHELHSLGVEQIGVFGSFGRGDAGPSSDVDVLVTFAEGQKSFDRYVALAEFLEETLGREVELVTREGLSRHTRERILEEVRYVDLTS